MSYGCIVKTGRRDESVGRAEIKTEVRQKGHTGTHKFREKIQSC